MLSYFKFAVLAITVFASVGGMSLSNGIQANIAEVNLASPI